MRVTLARDNATNTSASAPSAPIGLSWLDKAPIDALTDAPEEVIALSEQLTARLVEDPNGARLRTIARLVSIEKARLQMLEAMFGKALDKGRLRVARELDRFITTTTKRLVMLVDEHRRECRPVEASLLMIGHAGESNVRLRDDRQKCPLHGPGPTSY
jgi:hypothetical protein